jgi:hypothetical protein
MKYGLLIFLTTCLIIALTSSGGFSQSDQFAGLNGRQFICKITEITPPDVDRMPMFYDEVIRFEGGKISSDFLKRFIAEDVPFSATVDDRRAIAFTVVEFSASGNGQKGDSPVSITYKGNVVGYIGLNGEIEITGNGTTERYSVQSVNP